MKHTILNSLIIVLLLVACKQKTTNKVVTTSQTASKATLNYIDAAKPDSRLFPDKLRGIPNQITVAHYPNPCLATLEDSMYIWKHNTTVQTAEDLQIVEYGAFVYTAKGWYLRVTLTPTDFENYYNCKGGLLKKGQIYTDNASWRRDKNLTGGDAMWYYLAINAKGQTVKGMAPIETEATVITDKSTVATITKSTFNWTGYGEIGNYSLSGAMNLKNGTVNVIKDSLTATNIILDVTSITHTDKTLVDHLKSKDFFDVKEYPTATFTSTNIEYKTKNTATVTGQLTIKGVAAQIKVPVIINAANNKLVIKGKIQVDRTIFGIKFNSKSFFDNLGNQAIKNMFDVEFEVVANL